MASITSLSNSSYNTNSIYGTRNVLSGLASGMDTETMIENAVAGIKRKITSLLQKRTKIEWQQEAYRSIIDKAVDFTTKYTSYSSKTNLMSSSFFSSAVINTVNGSFAGKVSASGKTTSNIKINSVSQLATAASYSVSGNGAFGEDVSRILGNKEVDLSADMEISRISGNLTIKYGGTNGTSFDLSFDELEVYRDADDLAGAIRDKLGDISYTYTRNGVQETVKASDVINVNVDDEGNINFSDKTNGGNSVYISSASGNIKYTLGISTNGEDKSLKVGDTALSSNISTRNYLSDNFIDKTLNVSLNGVNKTISMGEVLKNVEKVNVDRDDYDSDDEYEAALNEANARQNEQFKEALQGELNKAFGAGKVIVDRDGEGRLSFKAKDEGSTLTLSGSAVKALGFENGDSNYVNTSKKISELIDPDILKANRLRGTFNGDSDSPIQKTTSSGTTYYVDRAGNRVDEDGFRITDTDDPIYDFEINGAHIQVTGNTTMESLLNSINSNVNAGVKVSYSKLTNEFKFTTTETGSNSKIEMGGLAKVMFGAPSDVSSDSSLADRYQIRMGDGDKKFLTIQTDEVGASFEITKDTSMEDVVNKANKYFNNFGVTASYDELSGQILITDSNGKTLDYKMTVGDSNDDDNAIEVNTRLNSRYTTGQDAVMDVEINGKRFEQFIRSSNSFDIDGLTINVKGTFSEDSFKSENGEDYEPITFTTTTDTEKIIDAIRSFVEDYNAMATEIKSAYSTMPAEKANGSRYEPLTAEDEESMTESAIKAYEEKAKEGILFGDTTLSSMYSKLLSAIAPGGADGQTLREIGIGTAYNNGMTTLSLDEDKLRAALEGDPDKVKDAFTKSTGGGSSTDGLMTTLQNTLNTYVKTTGDPKGVLITRAGSIKAYTSLNNNSLQSQINSLDNQIDRWQNKMSSQIDRYTKQFSRLEQLIAAMNSQASAMAGLLGGSEGYY